MLPDPTHVPDPSSDITLITPDDDRQPVAVTLPLDSISTITALAAAVARCTDPQRRARLAQALWCACDIVANPATIPTA